MLWHLTKLGILLVVVLLVVALGYFRFGRVTLHGKYPVQERTPSGSSAATTARTGRSTWFKIQAIRNSTTLTPTQKGDRLARFVHVGTTYGNIVAIIGSPSGELHFSTVFFAYYPQYTLVIIFDKNGVSRVDRMQYESAKY